MAKDLIIGGAANYDWSKLQYWVNSIEKTGFEGDVVLVATNVSNETLDKLVSKKVKIYAYGKQTERGIENQSKTAPHVERFFFIWKYLQEHQDEYRFVTVTDTRDVIFQTNPSVFLESKLMVKSLVCSSEGLLYKDEPWGNQNLLDTFGEFFYNQYKDKEIFNVGTIAGYADEVRDLLLMIFQLSINRPIPIVDQAVFNFIINQLPYTEEILKTTNKDLWAAQLGVTKYGIEAGAGDIGMSVRQDPSKLEEYLKLYQDFQPTISNHKVTDDEGNEFCIVHQWDRVPALKKSIENEYGDSECSEILTITT